jgi:hypothetical protein
MASDGGAHRRDLRARGRQQHIDRVLTIQGVTPRHSRRFSPIVLPLGQLLCTALARPFLPAFLLTIAPEALGITKHQ